MRAAAVSRFLLFASRQAIRGPRPLMMAALPSPTASPPHKRAKMSSSTTADPDPASTVAESPIKAMFVPPTTAEGHTPDTETASHAGPSKPTQQRQKQPKAPGGKKKKLRKNLPEPFSPAEVMFRDVRDFLGVDYVDELIASKSGKEWEVPEGLEFLAEVELTVGAFTVSGESISLYQPPGSDVKWAIITPFAHPNDRIRARIHKHDRLCCYADLVEILEYSEEYRGGEGDRRKYPDQGCKYFGECGGCQLQPLPYALQLLHKQRTVQLAYDRFSTLPADKVPRIQPTIGSPKQWGYRTKITPHFDAPPKWVRAKLQGKTNVKAGVNGQANGGGAEEDAVNGEHAVDGAEGDNGPSAQALMLKDETGKGWECKIGFERKGKPGVMDIEECPIATQVLNEKMTSERHRIKDTIMNYTKGATLLLRDSLPPPSPLPTATSPYIAPTDPPAHIAETNHRALVYESVGSYLFSFSAGAFFQNNNSILIPLTTYVREAIFPHSADPAISPPTHLVDTYCGSGLFGITLSEGFERVAGVEISDQSIAAAKRNAEMNGLEGKTEWLCGKAEDIFGGLEGKGFKGEKSCVVVDPPRKGCDTPFLDQLLAFKPQTIVYVSCNVHTQARDVGYVVHQSDKWEGRKYVLESLRGFDLFPQTAHVESVAVLRLV